MNITIWVMMFFVTPASMAVVMGGVQVATPFSEPGAMLLLGTSLIAMAGLCRKKVLKK